MNNGYDYWHLPNCLNENEIKDINCIVEKKFEKYENIEDADYKNLKNLSTKKIKWIDVKEKLNKIVEYYRCVNEEHFGFDLYSMNDYFYINYNIYDAKEKNEYKWHNDTAMITQSFDIKLTILINVSEEKYKGGNFQLFTSTIKDVVELGCPGNSIMFKSFNYHRVLPVENGVRKTLAIFLIGPKIK